MILYIASERLRCVIAPIQFQSVSSVFCPAELTLYPSDHICAMHIEWPFFCVIFTLIITAWPLMYHPPMIARYGWHWSMCSLTRDVFSTIVSCKSRRNSMRAPFGFVTPTPPTTHYLFWQLLLHSLHCTWRSPSCSVVIVSFLWTASRRALDCNCTYASDLLSLPQRNAGDKSGQCQRWSVHALVGTAKCCNAHMHFTGQSLRVRFLSALLHLNNYSAQYCFIWQVTTLQWRLAVSQPSTCRFIARVCQKWLISVVLSIDSFILQFRKSMCMVLLLIAQSGWLNEVKCDWKVIVFIPTFTLQTVHWISPYEVFNSSEVFFVLCWQNLRFSFAEKNVVVDICSFISKARWDAILAILCLKSPWELIV